jgi:hypothetical protein
MEDKEREMASEKKCCGTCRYHLHDDDVDFICDCEESEGYGDYTMYQDCCDCYEARNIEE